jgi:hypothetical protein
MLELLSNAGIRAVRKNDSDLSSRANEASGQTWRVHVKRLECQWQS